MNQETKKTGKGVLLVAFGACCWGISGNVGQFLKTRRGFSLEWLVCCRLLIGGFLLLCYLAIKYRKKIFAMWKNPYHRKALPIFASIQTSIMNISSNPIISEAISVNIICGLTASASGGLGISLSIPNL